MNPSVTALCLTADRQEQTERVVRCFLRQTYEPARLLIYDTGKKPFNLSRVASSKLRVIHAWPDKPVPNCVGRLRNEALQLCDETDIVVHFDSDDISTPSRIADQVAHLQSSGAQVVIYDDVLFWREHEQEAWMHSEPNPSVGASLCYRRDTWKYKPFPIAQGARGEDYHWIRSFIEGAKLKGIAQKSAAPALIADPIDVTSGGMFGPASTHREFVPGLPRSTEPPPLICTVHPGNARHYPRETWDRSTSWRRCPEYDALVREIVERA
jgi:hypothetical protein